MKLVSIIQNDDNIIHHESSARKTLRKITFFRRRQKRRKKTSLNIILCKIVKITSFLDTVVKVTSIAKNRENIINHEFTKDQQQWRKWQIRDNVEVKFSLKKSVDKTSRKLHQTWRKYNIKTAASTKSWTLQIDVFNMFLRLLLFFNTIFLNFYQ